MLTDDLSEDSPKSGGGGNGATMMMLVEAPEFCGLAESLAVRVTEKDPDFG
jgi:hypothetical protein